MKPWIVDIKSVKKNTVAKTLQSAVLFATLKPSIFPFQSKESYISAVPICMFTVRTDGLTD